MSAVGEAKWASGPAAYCRGASAWAAEVAGARLREISERPSIHAKISYFSLYDPTVPPSLDLAVHRDKLDQLTETFGDDRVVAGAFEHRTASDLVILREYYATKPRLVAEKFFWRNSRAIYRWNAREKSQS